MTETYNSNVPSLQHQVWAHLISTLENLKTQLHLLHYESKETPNIKWSTRRIFKIWDRPMREWILKDLEEKVHSFHNTVTHGGHGLWHTNNALYYIILHPLCQGHGLSGTYQGKDHLWQSAVIITIRIFIYVILLISILNIMHNSIMAEDYKTLIHVPETNIHKYKYKYTFSVGK